MRNVVAFIEGDEIFQRGPNILRKVVGGPLLQIYHYICLACISTVDNLL